ncbi:centrosomal protein of 57 kDa-like [Diadema antillarum]|uniref:centrosomal protein of 57 kDa-like n=1 Tax=Diadema antillarum TaxID=105358 RepID=UPI003A849435
MDKYSSYASAPTRRFDGVGGLESQPSPYQRTIRGMGGEGGPSQEDMSFNVESVSSYKEYPTARPLLADQVARRSSPDKVRAVPESNSRAVISALRGLQEKIRRLEAERVQAEANLKSLSTETSQYRQTLLKQTSDRQSEASKTSKQYKEVQTQLSGAEHRAALLEKQLEYMRRMVQTAESDRQAALRQADARRAQDSLAQREGIKSQEEKLRQMERDHARLAANQAASEGKIKELEERLQQERRQRKLLVDQAAELRTLAETNRIMAATEVAVDRPRPTKTKKKKRKAPQRTSPRQSPGTGHHCTGHLPFVVGKSTTPSHSVNANLQSVMALLKTHNTAWCNNGPLARHSPRPQSAKVRRAMSTSSSATDSDLSDLVLGLQEEFAQMGFEHQDLAKQIRETEDADVREDLERELDQLVFRMEAKGNQIATLKRHKEQVTSKSKKTKKTAKARQPQSKPAPNRRSSDPSSSSGAEVQVITTVRTKGKKAGPVYISNGNSKSNSKMLRDIRSLQTTLRKDDVSWD